MTDEKPMIDDDGEVRELTETDFAEFERGAPWTRPAEIARLQRIERATRDVVASENDPAAREALRRALSASSGDAV
ncbi:MAG: hypothetical protein AAF192_18445 [Pseudomonadota bacterium]